MQKEELKEVFFIGNSGHYYPFTLYPLETDLPDKGAVYIWARVEQGNITPLYVGQTDTLMTCIQNHERWACICKHFVNSVCVYFEQSANNRLQMVQDLLGSQKPPCNDT